MVKSAHAVAGALHALTNLQSTRNANLKSAFVCTKHFFRMVALVVLFLEFLSILKSKKSMKS
jgi:hypothetical protein